MSNYPNQGHFHTSSFTSMLFLLTSLKSMQLVSADVLRLINDICPALRLIVQGSGHPFGPICLWIETFNCCVAKQEVHFRFVLVCIIGKTNLVTI